jgi:phosphate transport system protein
LRLIDTPPDAAGRGRDQKLNQGSARLWNIISLFISNSPNSTKSSFKLSATVEERVRKAAQVIVSKDQEVIQSIILSDYEVDELEIEIEEDCLKILALHQPVARDLRFLVAVIKINTEMERIADIAVAIAMRVDNISKFKHQAAVSYDFSRMSDQVVMMLKKSIDALVHNDARLARSIFLDDDLVDACRNRCYEDIKERIKKDPHASRVSHQHLPAGPPSRTHRRSGSEYRRRGDLPGRRDHNQKQLGGTDRVFWLKCAGEHPLPTAAERKDRRHPAASDNQPG